MDRNSTNPRLVDYHMHTSVIVDGRMNEREACEQALLMGLSEIAFTNHVRLSQPDYSISPNSFLEHWERIMDCMQRFPMLRIRLGIEMDYYPDRENAIEQKINFYQGLIGRPFDIVLGSIHDIRGALFSKKIHAVDFFRDCDIMAVYEEYFDLSAKAARSRLFDVMAHPDLIKKFTYELTSPIPFESYTDSADAFINALIENEVGIELNTKGCQRPVNEMYPSLDFLGHYLAQIKKSGKVPIITVGSDAHKLDEIGYGIKQVYSTLKELQVSNISGFDHRRSFPIEI